MKTTPFYHWEVAAGGKMTTAGLSLPTQFVDPIQEHNAIRQHVGICDFSGMGEIDIQGKDARKFLDEHCVNNIATLKPGRIAYTTILTEDALIVDDTTVYCHSDDHFWVVTSAPRRLDVFNWLSAEKANLDVWISDISAGVGLLSVQGPDSKKMLSPIVPGLEELKFFGFIQTTVGDIPAHVSRTGFTGELGFEIYANADDASRLWEILQEAGKAYDCMFCGTVAGVSSIPLEKGLLTVKEYGDKRNPLEVGLGWSVRWDKPFFVGKAALEKLRDNGTVEMLMGFVVEDGKTVVPLGSDVCVNGKVVGKVTSAHYGHTVKKSIGMCHIATALSEIGQKVQIKTDAGLVDATIEDKTFYDPEKLRVKG